MLASLTVCGHGMEAEEVRFWRNAASWRIPQSIGEGDGERPPVPSYEHFHTPIHHSSHFGCLCNNKPTFRWVPQINSDGRVREREGERKKETGVGIKTATRGKKIEERVFSSTLWSASPQKKRTDTNTHPHAQPPPGPAHHTHTTSSSSSS